jgi:hypothetical protein
MHGGADGAAEGGQVARDAGQVGKGFINLKERFQAMDMVPYLATREFKVGLQLSMATRHFLSILPSYVHSSKFHRAARPTS